MKIGVVGAGYVGLPFGLVLAEAGHEVWVVEADPERLATLRRGATPVAEPGVSERLALARFAATCEETPPDVAMWVLAVGTPSDGTGATDLSAVWAATEAIAPRLSRQTLVVLKSTVPVGTTETLQRRLGVPVVYGPEFLRQGHAVDDTRFPSRILLGATDPGAADRVLAVLHTVVAPDVPVLILPPRSAEIAKYAANTMLAARISLMNEIAAICSAVGADVQDVARAVGMDPRIGPAYLGAGAGFGGSCLPKDLRAFIATARAADVEPWLLCAIARRNELQTTVIVEDLRQTFGGTLRGVSIALWGLAYKPGTDDVRDAPALDLVAKLGSAGAKLNVHDPAALSAARRVVGEEPQIGWFTDPYAAAERCDALLIVTEWPMYREVHFGRLRQTLAGDHLFDLRNQYVPEDVVRAGFVYHGIGRPTLRPPTSR